MTIKCTIFVGGNGRSGTSLVSRILLSLGYHTHPSAFDFIHEYSPLVYSTENGVIDRDCSLKNIRELNDQANLWFWKSPKDLGYFDKWLYLIRNPRIIIVTRDPKAIAVSSSAKERIPENIYYKSIAHTYGVVADLIELMPCPMLIVSYDDLKNNSSETISKIAKFSGVENINANEIAVQCVTETYSDSNGNLLKMTGDDYNNNMRVSYEANFLVMHRRRLSMIDDLLLSVVDIVNYKNISLSNAFLTEELCGFGFALNDKKFTNVIEIIRTLAHELSCANEHTSLDMTKEKIENVNNLTELLLMATCKLRINAQLYFEDLNDVILS